jgi:hypothetical protein
MAEKQVKQKPLEKMTAKELREMALTLEGIVGVHSMNKPELIAAIKEAKGITTTGGKTVDPAAIRATKDQIKALRAQREELKEQGGDPAKLDTLRKRISKLKKKTRRLAAG